ncbi:uncharacterized protein LOC117513332 [Thalassophryne amazonica]|uniref:uncharacterized protein LOC117513332 n=1 Tax=Thalassophryne amazonica TaxID=390379 RepID=UPI00147158E1|nr:uncharacterized protein LOC117513332 [Thalassophryne amazonica]
MFAGPMDFCVTEWVNLGSNMMVCVAAFSSSCQLFKNHRASSVGFFLLGLSAALFLFRPFSSQLASIQNKAEWSSEILAPALVSFEFLWLSEDRNTAHVLLCGSCMLLGLSDWLSADALMMMVHCLGLSSLSCCMMVCMFAGSALGAVGGVALSLPLLVASRDGMMSVSPLMSQAASEGLMKCFLKVSVSVGCWVSTQALKNFLVDINDRYNMPLN